MQPEAEPRAGRVLAAWSTFTGGWLRGPDRQDSCIARSRIGQDPEPDWPSTIRRCCVTIVRAPNIYGAYIVGGSWLSSIGLMQATVS